MKIFSLNTSFTPGEMKYIKDFNKINKDINDNNFENEYMIEEIEYLIDKIKSIVPENKSVMITMLTIIKDSLSNTRKSKNNISINLCDQIHTSTNKNVTFYPHNKNKNSKKQAYYSTNNLYIKEINEINKKLIKGEDNLELINKIACLLKKMKIFKGSNNFNTFLPLKNLLFCVDNNHLLNQSEIMDNFIVQEEEVENNMEVFITKKINVESNVKINQDYINYIKEYGLPDKGIFLPSKLYLMKNN